MHRETLAHQGVLQRRFDAYGAETWRLRFREQCPDGRLVRRSIDLGPDTALLDAVRKILTQYRKECSDQKAAQERARSEKREYRETMSALRQSYVKWGHSRRQCRAMGKAFDEAASEDVWKVVWMAREAPYAKPLKRGRPTRQMRMW